MNTHEINQDATENAALNEDRLDVMQVSMMQVRTQKSKGQRRQMMAEHMSAGQQGSGSTQRLALQQFGESRKRQAKMFTLSTTMR